MSKKLLVLPDAIPNVGFNLKAQEQFAKNRGVIFEHYAAIPSTIGAKDRGDYRRPDSLDVIAENGFIYKKVGEFVGTIVGNGAQESNVEGGIYDSSTARLIIPKFYNTQNPNQQKEIHLLPGDRVYAKDIALEVPNYQKVQYEPNRSDFLQFPAIKVEFLIDSKGIEYTYGVDFKLNDSGNVIWLNGGKNPGIDPDTLKGRIYGIRYNYIAYWYVQQLINEVRITNTSDANAPSRMPYHAVIQREYVYHNRKRGDKKEQNKKTKTKRTNEAPKKIIDPQNEDFQVKVETRDFE